MRERREGALYFAQQSVCFFGYIKCYADLWYTHIKCHKRKSKSVAGNFTRALSVLRTLATASLAATASSQPASQPRASEKYCAPSAGFLFIQVVLTKSHNTRTLLKEWQINLGSDILYRYDYMCLPVQCTLKKKKYMM